LLIFINEDAFQRDFALVFLIDADSDALDELGKSRLAAQFVPSRLDR
jgi:hypothetical protein